MKGQVARTYRSSMLEHHEHVDVLRSHKTIVTRSVTSGAELSAGWKRVW